MKIKVNKQKLSDLISKASKLSVKNANLPALSFIKMSFNENILEVSSTNLDIGFSGTVNIENQENTNLKESFLISGDLFLQLISNLSKNDSEIILEKEENTLMINTQKTSSKINLQKDEDFPSIPEVKTSKIVSINTGIFIEGIKKVFYSASNSTIKPELSSIFIYQELGELVFVATDSFRLAEKRTKIAKIEEFEKVLLPTKNALEIVRIFEENDEDVNIFFEEDQIKIENKTMFIVSRIVDGNFPDYKQIIPKNFDTKIQVLKQDFIQATKIANIFVDNFSQVTIDVDSKNQEISIYSKNLDRGDSKNKTKAKIEGNDIKINFNNKYITDCLNSIEDDNLILELGGANKPVVIRGARNDGFTYLVMPMNK